MNTLLENDIIKAKLLHDMPITFNGLVIENTNKCNARCAICYQSAGSENNNHIDINKAKKCIEEAITLDTLNPRFHLAGGEAFLYMDDCIDLFSTAKKAGYKTISATTNAFWCTDKEKAKNFCNILKDNGMTYIEISWDNWHKDFIKPKAIENCIMACYENEITTNLRILTTKSHSMEEALNRLDEKVIPYIGQITSSPVFAVGRATEVIPGEDFYLQRGGLGTPCYSSLNLTINAHGEVYPCCAGFDQCRDYSLGSIYDESIIDIVKRTNNDPIIRRLVFLTPSAFLPILKEKGVAIEEKCYNNCQLCSRIFSKKENIDIIKEHFEKRKQEAFLRFIEKLEAQLKTKKEESR
ncbi:MAG: SPASM domain-containing protein [Lachnospiraceae bacterium]|nr:SPASM domain-containing protein [Lachnospiraceae bacterium]